MAKKAHSNTSTQFRVQGLVDLEGLDAPPADVDLTAYVFDAHGQFLSSQPVTCDQLGEPGRFSVDVKLPEAADVEVLVGPVGAPEHVRSSSSYSQRIRSDQWRRKGNTFLAEPRIFLPSSVHDLFRPVQVCVSGRVQKLVKEDDQTRYCPVPFVKVEVFDVDRESCYWPIVWRQRDELYDRPFARVEDLVRERLPEPPPPVDVTESGTPTNLSFARSALESNENFASQFASQGVSQVGELRFVEPSLAARLEHLTLTARVAPWFLYPHCFYSKDLVCDTYTDCDGRFTCCFRWWPLFFRQGRLRYDQRPDIVVRVTQVINGVETVIYLDPYTSTRWNVSHAHINLCLDDERIECGEGCNPQPQGAAVFFTRVGNDEVYKINQGSGEYSNVPQGGALSNWAYGHTLRLYGVFGEALSDGSPKRYYRLSVRKGGGGFKPVKANLSDTRVHRSTFASEIYSLGPQPIGAEQNLYEVRNTNSFHWYNRDLIGFWNTHVDEADEGLYTVRLEVFDASGNKLGSADVDYRDGTKPPGTILPNMGNSADLEILVDNKAPDIDILVPAAINDCGVVPWADAGNLKVRAKANQENGRLYLWDLDAFKGLTGTKINLASATNGSGISPLPVDELVDASSLTAGLTSTCAFSLELGAWPLVRNGFGAIHHRKVIKAIAIEKCS